MVLRKICLTTSIIYVLCLFSCKDAEISEIKVGVIDTNDTWGKESHSSDADANYDIVFPNDKVLRFDITISEYNWNTMHSDLQENLSGSVNGGGPGEGRPGAGGTVDLDFTPVWVPATLNFENKVWMNIGIRFKGNSSLRSVYNSQNNKFSFKLDFDEFEDDYPEIHNQRFYGFKQLNLNNNFEDESLMREKVAPELFREFGLVAPNTAYVALYVDYGNGSQYFGLYTLVEEVDDTVLETQYENDNGNLYKPEGEGATFADGTFNINHMYKKTNEEENDYSDVEMLYNYINMSIEDDVETWQANVESVFSVDVFLKWLAANTIIQNWDTYGKMNHNYYLYNNPLTEKLEWIPWDNNEAFMEGKQGGALNIDLLEVDSNWPIISNVIKIEEYANIYNEYLFNFTHDVFTEEKMNVVYNNYFDLIHDYVISEEVNYTFTSENQFFASLDHLKNHVIERNTMVNEYLKQQY